MLYEHGPLENIRVESDYPDPQLPAGWVRIRVSACSLNYHDIFSRRGMPGIALPLPLIVGSDVAGTVAELGEGVSGWSTGERVLIDPLPNDANGGRMIGERFDGGRAEFCVVPASQLIRIPEAVADEAAAAIPLAYATAHRMLTTRGRIADGETVLVLGASGGVGTACVLLAGMLGAKVIACASNPHKLEQLQQLGAEHTVNYLVTDMREAVWDIVGKPRVTGSGGVDMVVNCSGGGTWLDSTRCMKVGARLVTCGATAGFEEQLDVRYIWTYEHSLLGSNGWRRDDILRMLDYAASGDLVPVVDQVFPLEQVHDAERLMENRQVFGKIVLKP